VPLSRFNVACQRLSQLVSPLRGGDKVQEFTERVVRLTPNNKLETPRACCLSSPLVSSPYLWACEFVTFSYGSKSDVQDTAAGDGCDDDDHDDDHDDSGDHDDDDCDD